MTQAETELRCTVSFEFDNRADALAFTNALAALPHLRPSTPEVGSAVRELVTELERKRGAHVGVDLTRVWEAYDKLKPLLDGAAK